MSDQEKTETPVLPKEPEFRILGSIGYNSVEELDKFIQNLDNSQALFVLISAANFAQSKGAYSLTEASMIAAAIKKFMKPTTETDVKNSE